MTQKDEVAQAKANMFKVIRTAVRLRHSIAADEELNEVLSRAEQVFDTSIQNGELPDPFEFLDALNA
jgi:hypothetical protein